MSSTTNGWTAIESLAEYDVAMVVRHRKITQGSDQRLD
jgi:hypothetical protein